MSRMNQYQTSSVSFLHLAYILGSDLISITVKEIFPCRDDEGDAAHLRIFFKYIYTQVIMP
jgi:hypothetical protein